MGFIRHSDASPNDNARSTIRARVLADSISSEDIPLTSVEITCHRFILAEVDTHRAFSRSFRSSRAVPVTKMIEEVRTNPALPVFWGRHQPGMGAREELPPEQIELERAAWIEDANRAADRAEERYRRGCAKEWVNRALEPYLWVHGVITSACWSNFFALRLDPGAQPEFRALAQAIWDAKQASVPRLLLPGEWHMCYVTDEERVRHDPDILVKVDAARCARVSYAPFDGNPSIEREIARYKNLMVSRPVHASPSEHQCTPDTKWPIIGRWRNPRKHGNTYGWIQHRKLIPHETVLDAFQVAA